MAEAIGLASGLLALSVFALKSSTGLHNTIASFHSHNSRVKDLQQELEALTSVLGSLSDTIGTAADVDLTSLDLPLRRCDQACRDFEQELLKCSSRSGGVRTSFRDWATLRYMGDDVDGFKRLLAGYKLTINIALTHASLRKSSLTAESLENYKSLIETAQEDLQAHLKSIDDKLSSAISRTVIGPSPDGPDLGTIKVERLSALRCLDICEQLSHRIDQMHLTADEDEDLTRETGQATTSQKITREGLEACKDNLNRTAARLENHMKNITDRIIQKSKNGVASEDDIADLERLQDEWDATRESVRFCSMAGSHLKNDVSSIENHGTGDSVQFMVSTNGQVVHGKNRGMGWKNRQVGGHMSDNVVLQLSRDMVKDIPHIGRNEKLTPQIKVSPAVEAGLERDQDTSFWDRHGKGFTLESQSTPNMIDSTTVSGDAHHQPARS